MLFYSQEGIIQPDLEKTRIPVPDRCSYMKVRYDLIMGNSSGHIHISPPPPLNVTV